MELDTVVNKSDPAAQVEGKDAIVEGMCREERKSSERNSISTVPDRRLGMMHDVCESMRNAAHSNE